MIKIARLLLPLLFAGLFSLGAHATILFQDNFNNENGGNSAENYDAFDKWNVINNAGGNSSVDIFKSGDGGLTGDGVFVDLDGAGPNDNDLAGIIQTKQRFTFVTGKAYELRFDMAGSGRGDGVNSARSIVTTIDGISGNNYFSERIDLLEDQAWKTFSIGFVGQGIDGRIRFTGRVGNNRNDDEGLLLDNVYLVAVPEPGTLGLLSLGLVGLILARRKS